VTFSRTVEEYLRKKQLGDDPMARVLGPFALRCMKCKGEVMLSSKGVPFDPKHWIKHRARCIEEKIAKPRGRPKKRRVEELSVDEVAPASAVGAPVELSGSLSSKKQRCDVATSAPSCWARERQCEDLSRWQSWDWEELRYPVWAYKDLACNQEDIMELAVEGLPETAVTNDKKSPE